MKNNRIHQIWLKQYLRNYRNSDFYEFRYPKVHMLINKRDFNIRGIHTSCGEFDEEQDIKAVYEYIERLMCLKLPGKITKEKSESRLLSLNELGFAWTENKFENKENDAFYVEAIGVREGRKYLIPAAFTYYLSSEYKKWNGFAGNSNGTALGDSFRQAYEAALMEFVERDKFIKYWFLEEGKIWKVEEKLLSSGLIDRIAYFKKIDYDVEFYFLDNQPQEIFTIWCLVQSKSEKNIMFSFSGLGTSTNLKEAVGKSFEEASGIFFSRKHDDTLAGKIHAYKENESSCWSLEENLYYYFSYDRKNELRDLLKDIPTLTVEPKETKRSLDKIVLEIYDDILYSEIENKILKDLGFYGVKVFGLGGHSLYFSISKGVMKRGKIEGPSPFA